MGNVPTRGPNSPVSNQAGIYDTHGNSMADQLANNFTFQNGYWSSSAPQNTKSSFDGGYDFAGNKIGPGGEVYTTPGSDPRDPVGGSSYNPPSVGPIDRSAVRPNNFNQPTPTTTSHLRPRQQNARNFASGTITNRGTTSPQVSGASSVPSRSPVTNPPSTSGGPEQHFRNSMVDIEVVKPDTSTLPQDAGQAIKGLPKGDRNIDKPQSFGEEGGTQLDASGQASKFKPKQTPGAFNTLLSTLQSFDPNIAKLTKKGDQYFANILMDFPNTPEGQAAAHAKAEEIEQYLKSSGIINMDKLEVGVTYNKDGKIKLVVRGGTSGGTGAQFTEPEGGTPADEAFGKTMDYNDQILALTEMLTGSAGNRAKSFAEAQQALMKQIQGIDSDSAIQKDALNQMLEVEGRQGLESISRDFNMNTRGVSADLMNRGFGKSNLMYTDPNTGEPAGVAFEEGVQRPSQMALRELNDAIIKNRFGGMQQIQSNAINKLNAVGGITGPSADVPGLAQPAAGTFAPEVTPQDILAAAELFGFKIPATQQGHFVDLIKSLIDAQSAVASPTAGAQILNAVGGNAGTATSVLVGK